MARVTHVKSARKDQGSCIKCGTEIKAGDPYKWFANLIGRSSIKKKFCASCQIRPSDMTTSPHLGALYSAIENAEDELAASPGPVTLDDFATILRTCGEAVREAGEGYTESAEAIVEGFGHETSQSEEIAEKAQELESFADELDSAADEIESIEDPDAEENDFLGDFDGETDDEGKPLDADEFEEFVEAKRQERRDEADSMVNDALSNCPM